MKQVYIIHGYDDTPEKHWYRWLEQALKAENISTHCLAIPNPADPNVAVWVGTLEKELEITSETVIVAHSLGTITTLCYLLKTDKEPKGIVLVSGFCEEVPHFESLNPFVEHLRSYHRVPKIGKGIVIASDKDSIVPTELSDRLATWLHCEFVRLPVAGHFLDREGYTQFPEVRDKVLEIFREQK